MDRSAPLQFRLDRERAVQEFHPLLHADQTKSSTFPCRFGFNARTGVANHQMSFIRRSPQSHFELGRPAMLCGIL